MDINRNALLLYLRDLRDLEIAKKKISALYSKEKKYMENGIQKILSRLDYIIQQNEYMIFNQHRIEAQNKNMISQNESMLKSLERTEQNTFESKEYAQLSLNYNKATAFFAAATYLEQR